MVFLALACEAVRRFDGRLFCALLAAIAFDVLREFSAFDSYCLNDAWSARVGTAGA